MFGTLELKDLDSLNQEKIRPTDAKLEKRKPVKRGITEGVVIRITVTPLCNKTFTHSLHKDMEYLKTAIAQGHTIKASLSLDDADEYTVSFDASCLPLDQGFTGTFTTPVGDGKFVFNGKNVIARTR